MNYESVHIYKWLLPISWIYGICVKVRNMLFYKGILHSRQFSVPTICVGNLAVGGTGKTPHTEYLIRLLHNDYHVAVLSRGYRRKTKGFLLANAQSSSLEIGDEPYQMMKHYPDIRVAVDENRCEGIEKLTSLKNPPVDVILLDDAYQHRYVNAGINILLTDSHRLFCDDQLLPAGLLREPIKEKERAQIVIVTKCPDDIKPIDYNVITKKLNLYPYQQLFFTKYNYGELYRLFGKNSDRSGNNTLTLSSVLPETSVLLFTGIANNKMIVDKLHEYIKHITEFNLPDHHNFTAEDMARLERCFSNLQGYKRIIITTEKDAARLQKRNDISKLIKEHLYVLPVKVAFLQDQEESFNQIILNYVRKN